MLTRSTVFKHCGSFSDTDKSLIIVFIVSRSTSRSKCSGGAAVSFKYSRSCSSCCNWIVTSRASSSGSAEVIVQLYILPVKRSALVNCKSFILYYYCSCRCVLIELLLLLYILSFVFVALSFAVSTDRRSYTCHS